MISAYISLRLIARRGKKTSGQRGLDSLELTCCGINVSDLFFTPPSITAWSSRGTVRMDGFLAQSVASTTRSADIRGVTEFNAIHQCSFSSVVDLT